MHKRRQLNAFQGDWHIRAFASNMQLANFTEVLK